MTRTERATSPRALLKDRSEARNGYDNSLRKGGAGAHNWGSLDDEGRFEREGQDDEADDFDEANKEGEAGAAERSEDVRSAPTIARRTSNVTDEDRENAINVRKNALKNGSIDLAAIARSSAAVSTSPPRTIEVTRDADTATVQQ